MVNPHRLRVLQAVIAAGSVQAAARSLHYAPATVSQHLAALAQETGLRLFEKQGRGITPTAQAHKLAEGGNRVLTELTALDSLVEDLKRQHRSHISLAGFASVAQQWIPQVVQEVRRIEPEASIEVILNEPGMTSAGPVGTDIDVRHESLDEPPGHFEGYDRRALCVEDFAVVTALNHPLAGANEPVRMQQLQEYLWVDHDLHGSPAVQAIHAAARAAGFTPRFSARLDDHYAALSLVSAGLGIAVLPQLALISVPAPVHIRPLEHPRVQRRIAVHIRNNARSHPLVIAAMQMLEAQAAEINSTSI